MSTYMLIHVSFIAVSCWSISAALDNAIWLAVRLAGSGGPLSRLLVLAAIQ
jgi:hypothetical protein